jgi:CheY-like chemotaxis protein
VPRNRLILVADDNQEDLLLLRRSFERAGILNPVREVRSGSEVIAYLKGEGEFADREKYPYTGILILDLHMPDGDGFEVLQWIRNKFTTTGLLIVVLSRLDEIKNINRAYSLGANSFLTKPGDSEELQALINVFREYWLTRNKLPELRGFADGS